MVNVGTDRKHKAGNPMPDMAGNENERAVVRLPARVLVYLLLLRRLMTRLALLDREVCVIGREGPQPV
jgi:hypothetical protein